MKTHTITILCCICCWFGFGQSITDIEYFYNTDPGFGNGISVTPNSNSGNLTQNISIPTPTNATGFNTLYLRAKDDNNVWSLYANTIFYIVDTDAGTMATEITAAEYFINTDPGFGNGNPIAIDPNSGNITQNLAIPIDNTLNGFNSLYIRTQDDLGIWSLYDTVKFYVIEALGTGASDITALEYFIDTDPGFGNANSITVNTNTGNINQNIAIPVTTLSVGFHNLYLRTQDDLGVWSLYDKRLFFVTPEQTLSPIASAEYFYDTDPGFGNGTAVALTPTGNTNEFTIDLSTTEISCDFHDFYIRLINEDGSWSLYDYGLQIEVFDNEDPTIVVFPDITAELDATGQASITLADVDNGTFDDCELVSVTLNQAQFNYTCANLGANTVTITATDAEDKVSTEDVTITVVDNINPVAVSQNITIQLDANGEAIITPSQIENGSTDNCSVIGFSLDVSSFDCSNLGENTVNLTVTDTSGNTNTTNATVTVEDTVKPTVLTQDITVQLDASGNATITASQIDNGSTDNCSVASRSIDVNTFDCSNLGNNTVTLTVTDQSGNSETATAIVTIEDSINPTVVTQNITLQLDATGNASIMASQIENGSTDNCAIASSSLDITSFDCSNLGNNTVTLSVTDTSGNTGTSTATVTVEDTINPVAIGQNITVQLDASGNATITADDIDNSSTDNCGITSKSLDVTNFNCTNLGANIATLTVEDSSGNSNSTSVTVTVEDSINPTVVTQNITVQLDASGNASIIASQIENGSTDNCAIASNSLDITSFDCSNLGNNTVTLSVTDTSGNTDSNTAIVTVEDAINPVAIGQNITVQLDASGNATITASQIDNGSTDNCSVASRNIDVNAFDCSNLGNNTVTLTVADSSGNKNSTAITVTVEDSTSPIAIGQDITRDLAGNTSVSITANDIDNGSYDNCDFSLSIDNETFTSPGIYPVVLTINDGSGNSNNTTVNVTIVDTTLDINTFETLEKDVKLYPNPTANYLNIDTDLNIESLSIYDLNGKKIETIAKPKNKININYLNSGLYFIRLKANNTIITKRIIKK